jgi:DNA (cytosine-5)-methyltransferase 1
MGYHRAGFDVVGVDIKPQPRYPFRFWQLDAMTVLEDIRGEYWPEMFDAIHASPVCKLWSAATPAWARASHQDQLTPARARLQSLTVPWVIENVPGAPMRPDLKLCGCMFGLPRLKRERWFETSWHAFDLRQPCHHKPGDVVSVTGTGGGTGHTIKAGVADWKDSMGIDWMTMAELAQAIPPAYTEYIGRQLLGHLEAAA